jgi:hypothetical protein
MRDSEVLGSYEMIFYKYYITCMKSFQRTNDFSHFVSLPFIRKSHRSSIALIQKHIEADIIKVADEKQLRKNSHMLAHLTLSMLNLPNNEACSKAHQIFE